MNKTWKLVLACVAFALVGFGGAASVAAQEGPTATLTVHYRVCDEIPADGDYFTACHDTPVTGGLFDIFDADTSETVASGNPDESGNITFELFAGSYFVGGPPGDFLDAVEVFCAQDSAPSEAIGYPVQLGIGGAVTCDFYIVPSCAAADGDCTPDTSPPPPAGDNDNGPAAPTPTRPVTTALPSTGSGAVSGVGSPLWSVLLVGAALALGAVSVQGGRRQA